MREDYALYYKTCRESAGLSQEDASDLLHIANRTLSKYENEGSVPDDIVKSMAYVYGTPMLGWWHLLTSSPLGEFLPKVDVARTNGDFMFRLIIAHDELRRTVDKMKEIYSDGQIDPWQEEAYEDERDKLAEISDRLASAKIYADAAIYNFSDDGKDDDE